MTTKECQQIGCQYDANMDDFEHFAHHRKLLIDIRANIGHEIGLEGRDCILVKDFVLVRGKEYSSILSTYSHQDIASFTNHPYLTHRVTNYWEEITSMILC